MKTNNNIRWVIVNQFNELQGSPYFKKKPAIKRMEQMVKDMSWFVRQFRTINLRVEEARLIDNELYLANVLKNKEIENEHTNNNDDDIDMDSFINENGYSIGPTHKRERRT